VQSSSAINSAYRLLPVAAIVLIVATSSNGQSPGRGTGQDIQSREWALTHISDEVRRHFSQQTKPSLPEIREDFHELQVVNNELMKAVFIKNLIETRRIRTSINEIRKRATRLRTNLGLEDLAGEPDKSRERSDAPPENTELASALLHLDRAVMDFVNNPLFEQQKVLDMKLAIQARDDLGEVLRLTEVIDRLVKQTQTQK
jgi:hypothetical protein